MRVGILGTGDVGQALGRAFIALGHEVKLGSRAAGNAKAVAWVQQVGSRGSEGTFAEAARHGELLVLATLGVAVESAIRAAGIEHFHGKVLLDTTNPLEQGGTPKLAVIAEGSGGQLVQRLLPEARVVKVFNTVGNHLMYKPQLPGGPPDMFYCGNDAMAKRQTAELITQFGWNPVEVGGIECAHYLEAMCMVWVLTAARTNQWRQAFKLLHD